MRVHARVHTHFGQGLYARTVQVILGITNYVKFGFPKILFNFPFSFIEFSRHLLLCLSNIHCPFLYSPVRSLGTPLALCLPCAPAPPHAGHGDWRGSVHLHQISPTSLSVGASAETTGKAALSDGVSGVQGGSWDWPPRFHDGDSA